MNIPSWILLGITFTCIIYSNKLYKIKWTTNILSNKINITSKYVADSYNIKGDNTFNSFSKKMYIFKKNL